MNILPSEFFLFLDVMRQCVLITCSGKCANRAGVHCFNLEDIRFPPRYQISVGNVVSNQFLLTTSYLSRLDYRGGG